MKVVFFGTPAFAAEFLKGLIADPAFEVVGVVTQPDEPVGRKKILTPPPVKIVALDHGIPVFQPTKLKETAFQTELQALQAEIGVVVAYGRILPESILQMFALGCLNVHPSLLPRYRGPSPIAAVIAAGDNETAVSVMLLVPEMDAGPILVQDKIALDPKETVETLTNKIVLSGVPLLNVAVKGYASGAIHPTEQNHSQATYCKLLTREDGVIDWNESAEAIERKVRAYNPWPGTSSQGFKIFAVDIVAEKLLAGQIKVNAGRILVGTGSSALEILEIQAPAGKRLKAKDFLNGHKDFDGKSLLE